MRREETHIGIIYYTNIRSYQDSIKTAKGCSQTTDAIEIYAFLISFT